MVIFVAEIGVGGCPARCEAEGAGDLSDPRQRRKGAEIGQIPRREQNGVGLAVGLRDFLLEFAIEREVAAEQS